MTLRPIAPHEVVVTGDKWRLENWPASMRPFSPPGIRQRGVSSPPWFGAISWAGLGKRAAAGATGIRANSRIRNP